MFKVWIRSNWHWLLAAALCSVGVLALAATTDYRHKWAYEASQSFVSVPRPWMFSVWMRTNWGWLLPANLVALATFGVAVATDYTHNWVYDVAATLLSVFSAALMAEQWWRMRSGRMARLEEPIEIPAPTCLVMLVFTAIAVLGKLYTFILKWTLYVGNCARVVEKGEEHGPRVVFDFTHESAAFWSYTLMHLAGALFLIVCLLHIFQRSKFSSEGTLQHISSNTINFIFLVLFLKALIGEAYYFLEEYCETLRSNPSKHGQALRKFCPKKNENTTAVCDLEDLFEMQKIWVTIHRGLLKDATSSIKAELYGIFLVAHILATGIAQKMARSAKVQRIEQEHVAAISHLGGAALVPLQQIQNGIKEAASVPAPSARIGRQMSALSVCIAAISVVAWHLSFFSFIRSPAESAASAYDAWIARSDQALKLVLAICAISLYAMTAKWVSGIDAKFVDVEFKANSIADQFLMRSSLLFQLVGCTCQMAIFGVFLSSDLVADLFAGISMFRDILLTAANVLAVYSLRTIVALPEKQLHSLGHFLPVLSICATIYNLTFITQTYFSIEANKAKLLHLDRHLYLFVVPSVTAIGGYLLHLTSALTWLEIYSRYKEMGFFSIERKHKD